jgi:phosphohistidine swiveling domain-containing protein/isopentenyldiphosphate isomerase
MAYLKTNLFSFASTLVVLPKVGWQFRARYNPQVVLILKSNGFSHSEALKIASNPKIRTFSGKLFNRRMLFQLGVGSNIIQELKQNHLLAETVHLAQNSFSPFNAFFGPFSYARLSSNINAMNQMNYPRVDHNPNHLMMDSSGCNEISVQGRHDLQPITNKLKTARNLIAENRGQETVRILDEILTEIKNLFSKGINPQDPLLSYFYAVKLMRKFANVPNNVDTLKIERRKVIQILVLDSKRQHVLLQKRGPFKRMFSDTLCVTANAKPKKDENMLQAAVKGIKEEVGVDIDPVRFEQIGRQNQYDNHLTSYNFYAFSSEEECALKRMADKLSDEYSDVFDIMVRYNSKTRSLMVFTTNSKPCNTRLKELVEPIKEETGIPFLFAFSDSDVNSLLVYQLNELEESAVRLLVDQKKQKRIKALEEIQNGITENTLKDLDSDEMVFVPWIKIRCDSVTNPEKFTTVLTGPYFPNDAVWSAMGFKLPKVLNIDDPLAGLACISGGKGSNTHILRKMKKNGYRVPVSSVLTTLIYEELVFNNHEIRKDIELLDKEKDEKLAYDISARIRERIMAIELPDEVQRLIRAEFERLGEDIAVRSSATSEDLKKYQAAGQANSCLHQVKIEDVFTSVKIVWASLFSDGFVSYRNSIGFAHSQARMAVLFQEFIKPKAAGVIFSFDQATERPVFSISAQPGVGEGVVEGEGLSDRWLVGSLCDYILQRTIPVKKIRVVPVKEGGVIREKINMIDPSIADRTILNLAKSAREIHQHYKDIGLADDVDIEYVVDENNNIVIVQTRAKRSKKIIDQKGRTIIKVKTVDDAGVPPGTVIIQLDKRSETAVQGAVVAKLHLDPNREPKKCLPGTILVSHHTNNDYNAAFGSLAGVITTDGGQTSHASEHAFEKKIPCVVGSIGALDKLADYDGQLVTFDAGEKRIYFGEMPIVEEERELNVWLTDEKGIGGFIDEGSRHENLRPWEITKRRRPKVFIEDPEFHCRRRSNTYGYFQLDYFYKAWDRQAEILNNMFAERKPWTLIPQGRQLKVIEDKHQLVHILEDDDKRSIYHFLMGVPGFGMDDMESLFASRLKGFQRFAAFTHSLSKIDAENVEAVSDEFLNIFSWMHFGFWLDSVVEEFAFQQLRYISNEGSFHKVLREEAIAGIPRDFIVDPLNPAIPAGKLLNLTREKEKEIYALLEIIRCTPDLLAIFDNKEPSSIHRSLETTFPGVLATIERWSMRYKLTLEDLDVLSDTDEYISEICKKIKNNSSMSEEMISNIYRNYLKVHGQENSHLNAIREKDPNLYLLLRSRARTLFVGENEDEISRRLPEVLGRLDVLDRSDSVLRNRARQVLEHYPEIKKVLMVSKLQFPLREDAHHLIVPLQRRIALLMFESAQPFVGSVFQKPEDVFNISTDEFIALFKEKDPSYVALSLKRWQLLLKAEKTLQSSWTVKKSDFAKITSDIEELWDILTYERNGQGFLDSRGFIQDKGRALTDSSQLELPQKFAPFREQIFAVLRNPLTNLRIQLTAFESVTNEAIQILEQQIQTATLPRVKKYYKKEQDRLRQRIEDLKNKLRGDI